MKTWIRARLSDRARKIGARQFYDVRDEALGRYSLKDMRGWDDRELHEQISDRRLQPDEHAMAERELRRREAWAAPAGKAILISLLAMGVSVFSIALSLFK